MGAPDFRYIALSPIFCYRVSTVPKRDFVRQHKIGEGLGYLSATQVEGVDHGGAFHLHRWVSRD